MMIHWNVWNRTIHYWASLIVFVPLIIVLTTGVLLLWKKEVSWIQPPTQKGVGNAPLLSFEKILSIAQAVKEAELSSWKDIDRLDVQPNKGMLKIQGKNHWEIQVDTQTGDVLQVAKRRSDVIETIHDGSWFHDLAKHWVFFPSAVALIVMWITGVYLFIITELVKFRKRYRLRPQVESE